MQDYNKLLRKGAPFMRTKVFERPFNRYTDEDIKKYGLEQVQRWIDEDHERLETYGDEWWMIGIRAAADIYIPAGDSFIIQLIESPGV